MSLNNHRNASTASANVILLSCYIKSYPRLTPWAVISRRLATVLEEGSNSYPGLPGSPTSRAFSRRGMRCLVLRPFPNVGFNCHIRLVTRLTDNPTQKDNNSNQTIANMRARFVGRSPPALAWGQKHQLTPLRSRFWPYVPSSQKLGPESWAKSRLNL